MTKYLVLRVSPESSHWAPISEVDAEGPRSAIAKALEGAQEGGAPAGSYVAVPSRSWKPINVEPKTGFKFS